MRIGVGVEGPSDLAFWEKVLHKHLRGTRFDIRNMKNCDKLIREAPQLLDSFRDLHYEAGFLLLDYDKVFRVIGSCPAEVLQRFDTRVREEATKAPSERYLFVCVAVRGLEAWYLADGEAIGQALPDVTYAASPETGSIDAGTTLKTLWRQQYGNVAFNKIDFAKRIAPRFKPDSACAHSASFTHFWARIGSRAQS